jgi:hypothetical protein
MPTYTNWRASMQPLRQAFTCCHCGIRQRHQEESPPALEKIGSSGNL